MTDAAAASAFRLAGGKNEKRMMEEEEEEYDDHLGSWWLKKVKNCSCPGGAGVKGSCTRLEIMVMWLKVPWSPCFRGTVEKKTSQSLEKTGSSFWWERRSKHHV